MNPLAAFDRILAMLHRAALNDVHWPAATALIEEACSAKGNLLVVGEGTDDELCVNFFQLLYRGEPRQDLARTYFEDHRAQDEGAPRLQQRPFGQLVHLPDLYTERELKTSVWYNEGLGPPQRPEQPDRRPPPGPGRARAGGERPSAGHPAPR